MLRPMPIEPVPHETVHVARAAFPKGNRYLRLADEVEMLFTDDAFRALFPTHGQPAWPPWRLALATILQCAEGLSDRQAAHAVHSRIDWKYVLRLEFTDPGFDASVLSEFRTRLLARTAEYRLFDTLLTWCRDRGLVKAGGRRRTDSTHILAAVRALNRIKVVGETMRHALNSLAIAARAALALTIRPQPYYQALRVARQREAIDTFQAEYARRAGIEATISRGVRGTRLRRTRYRGLARVHLGHILTAVGLNVLRLGEWFLENSRAKTRITPFARLMADTTAA